MAATRSLLKSHSNLTSQFLCKPLHLTTPIARSTIIDEALSLPLSQKSQHPPPPAFFLSDFLEANQKLLVGEEGFLSARKCLQTGDSAVGGSLLARGRGGSSSSRKQIDSDDDVDEFDDDEDDFPEDLDDQDFDGQFSEDFDDDDDDEVDNKPRRKK